MPVSDEDWPPPPLFVMYRLNFDYSYILDYAFLCRTPTPLDSLNMSKSLNTRLPLDVKSVNIEEFTKKIDRTRELPR